MSRSETVKKRRCHIFDIHGNHLAIVTTLVNPFMFQNTIIIIHDSKKKHNSFLSIIYSRPYYSYSAFPFSIIDLKATIKLFLCSAFSLYYYNLVRVAIHSLCLLSHTSPAKQKRALASAETKALMPRYHSNTFVFFSHAPSFSAFSIKHSCFFAVLS